MTFDFYYTCPFCDHEAEVEANIDAPESDIGFRGRVEIESTPQCEFCDADWLEGLMAEAAWESWEASLEREPTEDELWGYRG